MKIKPIFVARQLAKALLIIGALFESHLAEALTIAPDALASTSHSTAPQYTYSDFLVNTSTDGNNYADNDAATAATSTEATPAATTTSPEIIL